MNHKPDTFPSLMAQLESLPLIHCKAYPKKVCEEHHGKESEQFSVQCDCTGTRPESPVHGVVTEEKDTDLKTA